MTTFDPFPVAPHHRPTPPHHSSQLEKEHQLAAAHPRHPHLARARVATVPDLRYEQSYLRGIAQYIYVSADGAHVRKSHSTTDRPREESEDLGVLVEADVKGKGKEKEAERPYGGVEDEWTKTTSFISPHVGVPLAEMREVKATELRVQGAPVALLALPHATRVEWGRVGWVTVRDQVLSPFIQGALWALVSTYITPSVTLFLSQVRTYWMGTLGPAHTSPGEGRGTGWLRAWGRSLGLG